MRNNETNSLESAYCQDKNKEIVLRAISKLALLSHAEIAQRTGLNKATISSLVSGLIDEELIYEVSQTIDNNLSSNQQIQFVIKTIHTLISHILESRYGVIGIGIGVPGIVDNEGKVQPS